MFMDDEKDWKYRLEFHEERQVFHMELLNKTNVHEENTFGWKTIYKAGNDFFLSTFIKYIEWRYEGNTITKSILKREMKAYKFIAWHFRKKHEQLNAENKI